MTDEEILKYRELMKNDELKKYLITSKSKWYIDKYEYFMNKLGTDCKYANACLKLMKEDIDEFYLGRKTDNP